MKYLYIIFLLFWVSCSQGSTIGALKNTLHITQSNDELKKYIEMADSDIQNEIESAILSDCESKSIGNRVKELEKIVSYRKIISAKKELSDNEVIAVIEQVKLEFKTRKAALCW